MKKLLVRLAVGLLLVVIVAILARNLIARVAVEAGVTKATGFPLTVGTLNVGLFDGTIAVHNIKLFNPPAYKDDHLFADLPQLNIDYQLGSMLHRAPHLNNMLIDVHQLVLIKTARGSSNAQQLKGVVSSGGGSHSTKYQIDTLKIHVGSVTVKDYSRAKPSERTFNLNANVTYTNISDATDISRLVLLTIASQINLSGLGINVDDLKKNLDNAANAATEAVKGAADTLEKTTRGLFDSLKGSTTPTK